MLTMLYIFLVKEATVLISDKNKVKKNQKQIQKEPKKKLNTKSKRTKKHLGSF